ncbi:FAD-dependent oxidoreductase [Candidatus Viridilinea mediisalina]|uniref:CoA-disulfide reductase n=1 Tax=Candidatus Viridilinea mediisalina TaxID=2024553 RepID=A0A2A6RP39_9CHLR|nr:FAD-dependent oxidoreductase [Candidatus Viridilinea mediisalina]PDW04638.1 CoA-disulfide reductase [Candidatus Viridilinea mediisalina]
MKKIVIVGGVAAGMSTAARLRRLDEQAEIVVLERDRYVSYANCGLPYHIGGAIPEREQLLVVTPEHLRATLALDVRTEHEVVSLDRAAQQVEVHDHAGDQRYTLNYDLLVLAQGATPLRPPIPGIDHPRVFTLRNIPDMDAIIATLNEGGQRVVVVGGSYIGVEVAEGLRERGLEVHLVELQDQLMPLFDREMATDLRHHMEAHGVQLHLGTAATKIEEQATGLAIELRNGTCINADLVVLAAGVRPLATLAQAAGLELGPRGGIKVDASMRTSDPKVYAAGDMVEVTDTVTGEPTLVALAGPANRQGRIVADQICGRDSTYSSTQGSAIVKLFAMTAAATGASERTLQRCGMAYRKVYLHPAGHASYYPGSHAMHMKLLFAPEDGRILGAQIVGYEGVAKRIDVLATALRGGMTVYELEHLELAYAPPYSSAKDPVNMAGFIASNLLRGDLALWYADEYEAQAATATFIDVRGPDEYAEWHIAGAINIPLPELRERIDEVRNVAQNGPIRLYCMVGFRSYLAYRVLHQHGFSDVATLAGGVRTFVSYHEVR